jgi:hypothetical protein
LNIFLDLDCHVGSQLQTSGMVSHLPFHQPTPSFDIDQTSEVVSPPTPLVCPFICCLPHL